MDFQPVFAGVVGFGALTLATIALCNAVTLRLFDAELRCVRNGEGETSGDEREEGMEHLRFKYVSDQAIELRLEAKDMPQTLFWTFTVALVLYVLLAASAAIATKSSGVGASEAVTYSVLAWATTIGFVFMLAWKNRDVSVKAYNVMEHETRHS